MRHKLLLTAAAMALAWVAAGASAHNAVEKTQAADLARLVDESNLVFIGKVEKVIYRNAVSDKDEGLIPYTIVTYRIDKVLRGKAPGEQITLRLVGGPDGRGRFLSVTGVPVIQEGDEDLLFVENTQDASCPLVFCEHGRYRILNDRVFDTYGSPVHAIVKSKVISRGVPPKAFKTIRFPAPKFDELIQNPEVIERLRAQKITVEEARRRYEAEAPRGVEVSDIFSRAQKTPDVSNGESAITFDIRSDLTEAELNSAITKALPLSKFVEATKHRAKRSKRAPSEVRSIAPAAEIVVPGARPTAPPEPRSLNAQGAPAEEKDMDEYEAFEQNGFNPVLGNR